jgi:hypothetical protein
MPDPREMADLTDSSAQMFNALIGYSRTLNQKGLDRSLRLADQQYQQARQLSNTTGGACKRTLRSVASNVNGIKVGLLALRNDFSMGSGSQRAAIDENAVTRSAGDAAADLNAMSTDCT